MKTIKKTLFLTLILLKITSVSGQEFNIQSKDKNTTVNINIEENITFSVKKFNETVIEKGLINLNLYGNNLAEKAKVLADKIVDIDESITSIVPQKNKIVQNSYKELQLKFKGHFEVHFRVYNEGFAYRFVTNRKGDVEVFSEDMQITFPEKTTSYFPKEDKMYSHFEREYLLTKLDTIPKGDFCSLPALFNKADEIRILFSEADLYDYPNMFLEGTNSNTLKATFPKVVLETKPQPGRADRNVIITKEANYIAKTSGKRTYPWRFFVITHDDKTLLEEDMVFKLSRPNELETTDWIKPGKIAWDWYNANNIYDVDFKSGLNTQTYKYYIDFASQYGLEYVILDEGWTKSTTEILDFNPEMDIKTLIDYGKEKNVGIILWCLWKQLDDNMETILQTYADWGAVGVKVDFMQRADQYMVNSFTRIAKEAAKRNLLVDFHGAYKPAGLRRAYPNVLSYEGVKGNENNKWESKITPKHNVTLPFIRMVVGPMDYTPGAMRNAQENNHHVNFDRPVSLGTRAHQVAMYVVFESALQMLCDAPSSYLEDKNTIEFISKIPTVWDETIPLKAKVGEYVAIARKNKDIWYVGAMTNWEARALDLDFSFLPKGSYSITIFHDGINANTYAEDYKVSTKSITNKSKFEINLAKGGGWSAIIKVK